MTHHQTPTDLHIRTRRPLRPSSASQGSTPPGRPPGLADLNIRFGHREPLRKLTASEASRQFASVLDAVEEGETVIVTRGGRRVAQIGPASAANGAGLRADFDRWRGDDAIDSHFAAAVAAGREAASADLDADPWHHCYSTPARSLPVLDGNLISMRWRRTTTSPSPRS